MDELKLTESQKTSDTIPNIEASTWVKDSTTALVKWIDKPNLPERYKHTHSWKVRETYENPDNPEQLIIIATDRVSTHDVVHKTPIQWKWTTLTQISNFWFDYLKNHEDTKDIPTQIVEPQSFPSDFPEELKSKTIIVKKLEALPIEAIVRWYLYWTALKWYDKESWKLKTWEFIWEWLEKCSEFDEPKFTPSTKEKVWHDVNVDFDFMVKKLTEHFDWDIEKAQKIATQVRDYSLLMYKTANEYAISKWMVIWDTKFEFWLDPQWKLCIIDEVLTPDSSRFWSADSVVPWQEPESFDKQYVRDYVEKESKKLWKKPWDIALELPEEVVNVTVKKYWKMANLFN